MSLASFLLSISTLREYADDALIEMLRMGAAVERAAQRVGVQAVAALQRRGCSLSWGSGR